MATVTISGREPVPNGTYKARLTSVEEREDEKSGRIYFLWLFELELRDGQTRKLSATSSTEFGPRAKARGWAETLRGQPFTVEELGQRFELNDLAGTPCLVDVRTTTRDGQPFNTIATVLAAPDA